MLCSFLDRETAKAMGLRVVIWDNGFFFALGLAVSAASKITGAILIFCYVVVAPGAAFLFRHLAELGARIEHRSVVRERNVVGDGVTRTDAVSALVAEVCHPVLHEVPYLRGRSY